MLHFAGSNSKEVTFVPVHTLLIITLKMWVFFLGEVFVKVK